MRLLGAFDNYLVGYRYRDEMLSAARRPLVYVGGIIKPTVLVDGRIAGLWRLARTAKQAELTVTLFDDLTREQLTRLDAEADDVARFTDQSMSLDIGRN